MKKNIFGRNDVEARASVLMPSYAPDIPYNLIKVDKNVIIISNLEYENKGVGEGGAGGGGGRARASPLSKVGGRGTSGFVPPTFGQSKCSNFTICSYFVVKNTFFQNFLGSLRSPTLITQYFLNFANLKL